jgi:catechol 2,3-dioxygenase-like lactoylglutathione lyase family enzyme
MPAQLTYVIMFVENMEQAIRFHTQVLGLPLKFQSPDWSEFLTGETTLALHRASAKNPAGKVQLGFKVPDLAAFGAEMAAKGYPFTQPPRLEEGTSVAVFAGAEGIEYRASGA